MAGEAVFIDTNVLVYATRVSAPQHAAARAPLSRLESEGSVLWISPQVLREYLAVVTRPQASAGGLPMTTAIDDVHRFRATFEITTEGPSVLDRLLTLLAASRGGGSQVHDANIVAMMLDHDIRRLLIFNVADFRRFARLIEIEPLA